MKTLHFFLAQKLCFAQLKNVSLAETIMSNRLKLHKTKCYLKILLKSSGKASVIMWRKLEHTISMLKTE